MTYLKLYIAFKCEKTRTYNALHCARGYNEARRSSSLEFFEGLPMELSEKLGDGTYTLLSVITLCITQLCTCDHLNEIEEFFTLKDQSLY